MADRNTPRSDRRDGGGQDPFADLARIIGFDPRVKVQSGTGRAGVPANDFAAEPPPSRPSVEFQSTPERQAASDSMSEWDAAFSGTVFTPNEDGVVADLRDRYVVENETGIPNPDLDDPTAEGSDGSFQAVVDPQATRPATSDRVAFQSQDLETEAEIDLVTQAFERAWVQTNQWSTEIEEKDFQAALDVPTSETASRQSEGETSEALSAIDLLGDDLDNVLAESIERDLEDTWLQRGDAPEPDGTLIGPAPSKPAAGEYRQEEPHVPEALHPFAAAKSDVAGLDFEDELRSLLNEPAGEAPHPAIAGTKLSVEPDAVPLDMPGVEPPPPAEFNLGKLEDQLSAETAVRVEPHPFEEETTPFEQPSEPVAPATPHDHHEPTRPRPFSLDVGSLDDDPFAALAAMAERYRSSHPLPVEKPADTAAPGSDPDIKENPEVEDMKRTPSDRYEAPDIETFDVPERPVAAADDLDFPQMPIDEPPAARSRRGVDAEFEDLLEEMSSGELVRPAIYQPRETEYRQPRPVAAHPAQRQPATRGYEEPTPSPRPERQSWDVESRSHGSAEENEDFFTDADVAGIADGSDEQAPRRKRGKWLAALFGSVVIAGGAGAFAMKFTGIADGGLPILVKADASPIKVRPDRPGGAVVPNQDNEVYDRVAGNPGVTPAQESLLSSAEEPMSLDDTGMEDDALPGLDMGEEIEAEPDAKAEDRLTDDEAADAPRPSEEPIAVTPRKVRTVAVRADGTLVQDEPAPVVENLVASAGQAIDKVRAGSAGVDTTDSTNSIAPDASDDVAAAPASATSARLDVVEAQAAAGTWSVQIASQPSEVAARSSYADLAKRYSAILAGRSVNIVKTEIAGKGTFWRVRVPADTRSAAVDLCTTYKAAGGNCFVSK